MLTGDMVSTTAPNDAELVKATLAGDREAFERIVSRYQALICTLTYSATGNLSLGEDLAQETFVTAWKQLAHLREPEKLRSWLCGIARNLVHSSLRKQGREPSHAAESIETAAAQAAPGPQPADHAMTREEQAILWRALENIPETYREPLILFYREHQSVQAVAEKMDLTPDAVQQRLSRGRKLLAEEVTAFVEGALVRTGPGPAFTLGVLAMLPTMTFSTKAATLGAVAKGGIALKGSVFGMFLGPALGLVCGALGWREHLKITRTPRERTAVKRYGWIILAGGILFFIACSLLGGVAAPRLWDHHPVLVLGLAVGTTLAWGVFAFYFGFRHQQAMGRLRGEERRLHPELFRTEPPPAAFEYRSRATFLGLPLVDWRGTSRLPEPGEKIQPAVGWIAIGRVAYGILYASGGVAVGGISVGGVAVGLFAFGGFGIGLLAFGGLAFGAVAMGGAAGGWIASGGVAVAWHAALGGIVAAHHLAAGGAVLAPHANDQVAWTFYQYHPWLNFMQPGPAALFWGLCFGPLCLQGLVWSWWRRKILKRVLPG